MTVVKRIGVLSVARIGLLFGILLGLVAGLVIGLTSQFVPEAAAQLPAAYSMLTGWKAIIIGPIFYGILYFVTALIGAALYNLFAKWVGGVSVVLLEKKK